MNGERWGCAFTIHAARCDGCLVHLPKDIVCKLTSQTLRLTEDKCQSLETRVGTLESIEVGEGWSPSPNTDVQIKLLGDSNFSNKVIFTLDVTIFAKI